MGNNCYYLIRLDDACPSMNREKWEKIEKILDKFNIKPMVGIIPNNQDIDLLIDEYDTFFWDKASTWQKKDWTIALHGYNHCYISNTAGINPLWNRSEFAGVSLKQQKEKIRQGVSILRDHGLVPKYFFAPSHTFDENTLLSLKEESEIRIISDTIALKPYKKGQFYFIPQISGHCSKMILPGIYTFCLHPNTMNDGNYKELEAFLNKYNKQFISFDQIELSKLKRKSVLDMILSCVYFTNRKIRRIA